PAEGARRGRSGRRGRSRQRRRRRQRADRHARACCGLRRLVHRRPRSGRWFRGLGAVPGRGGPVSIRVLVADDQPLVRSGFRMVLDQRPDLELVGEAADGLEALRLSRELDPDVILMDVRMPNMDGVEATRRLVESGARARVLVLTTFDLDEYVYAAIRAGASGFLLKDVEPAALVDAIRV